MSFEQTQTLDCCTRLHLCFLMHPAKNKATSSSRPKGSFFAGAVHDHPKGSGGLFVWNQALLAEHCPGNIAKDPPCFMGATRWWRSGNPSKLASIWIVTIVDSGYFVHNVWDLQPTYDSVTRESKYKIRIAMQKDGCVRWGQSLAEPWVRRLRSAVFFNDPSLRDLEC